VDEDRKRACPSMEVKPNNKHRREYALMKKSRTERKELQEQSSWSILEELAREGAKEMLARAMELEVAEFVEKHKEKTGEDGHRLVVRNGYMEEREIITGIGTEISKSP